MVCKYGSLAGAWSLPICQVISFDISSRVQQSVWRIFLYIIGILKCSPLVQMVKGKEISIYALSSHYKPIDRLDHRSQHFSYARSTVNKDTDEELYSGFIARTRVPYSG